MPLAMPAQGSRVRMEQRVGRQMNRLARPRLEQLRRLARLLEPLR